MLMIFFYVYCRIMKALAFAGIAGVVIPLIAPEIVRLRNALEDDLVQKYNSVNGIKDELMSLTDELSSTQSWVEKLEQIIWPCDEMIGLEELLRYGMKWTTTSLSSYVR